MFLIREWRKRLEGLETSNQLEVEQQNQDEVVQSEKEDIDEVTEPSSMESEDSHGGNEATGDIENSPNAKENGEQESEPTTDSDSGSSQSENNPSDKQSEDSHGGNEATGDIENSPNAKEIGEQESEPTSEISQSENNPNNSKAKENSESEFGKDKNNKDLEHSDFEFLGEDNGYSEINHKSLYRELELLRNKRFQSALATVISKLAEDLNGYDTDGEDLWDVNELMIRQFTNRSLHTCRKSLEREKIILALDFSGSCLEYSQFFQTIAKLAEKSGDVGIFDISNGFDDENYCITDGQYYPIGYFHSRSIIFFGDFDGGASLVELSKKANLYWFSCEERYRDLYEHDWCGGYTLKDFKNFDKKYFECTNENQFIRLIKKIRR